MTHQCTHCKKPLELNQVWVDNGGELCQECVLNSVPCACGCGRRAFVNPMLADECRTKQEREKP